MRLTMIALASLAISTAALSVQAADLPPAPILDDMDEPADSGLYLRGDIGLFDQIMPRQDRDLGSAFLPPLIKSRLDRGFVAGGGIGYQFLPWFRADVTVDHRFNARFKGTRFASQTSYAVDRAEFEATTFLVNGYVDLALWNGITPYLGAGIGVSHSRFDNMTRDLVAPGAPVETLALGSRTETGLAWALMAGVGFDLGVSLKLDLGYRYTRLEDAHHNFAGLGALARTRDVDAHEFRIGARYMLD